MSTAGKQGTWCCCVGGSLGFRWKWFGIDIVDAFAIVGDDEQATGSAAGPVEVGKIILETLRIFCFALRGPRSCCTAIKIEAFFYCYPKTVYNESLPSLFILTKKHRANRQDRHWFRWVLSTGHLSFNSPCALHT